MMIDYININYDEYFIGMIEVLASKTKIFIVLELVNGGELFDRIVQVGKLKEEQARFYFQQLVEGVEYCHKLGKMIILHIYCCCSYCCRCCCCC